MKKVLFNLLIVPLLFAMVACGSGPSDFNGNNNDDQLTADGGEVEFPELTPEPSPTPDGPEIAEENPCQGIPGGCPELVYQVNPNVLTVLAKGKSAKLIEALKIHTAVVYAHQGTWSQANSEQKLAMIKKVETAWNNFLGHNSLVALQAAVEANPQQTLNQFLQFYRYTIFNGPEDNFFQGEFEAVGSLNREAYERMQDALYKAEHFNVAGANQDLEEFQSLLPKPYLVLQTAFLRIGIESAAKRFGLKDYFGSVSAKDENYEALVHAFSIDPAVEMLKRFRQIGAKPGMQYNTCNANPYCPEGAVDAYAAMVFELPSVWENVVFKTVTKDGTTHLFSYVNFVHVPSNGKMFGLARGTFGVHPVATLKFFKDNEI